ncbi:hypothetical protein I552_8311 [Mycobacterium xenopi 3993]|nr:hypothetical protein I552_8311 [Mycobacterium xenopi 3993]
MAVAPFDPAVGAALAAAGIDPSAPTYLGAALAVRLRHDSDTARRQDALGSMLWRSLQLNAAPRVQILMPPAAWNLSATDAQAILTTLATSIRSGLAVPRPLPAVIADTQAVATAPLRSEPTRLRMAGSTTTSPLRSPPKPAGCGLDRGADERRPNRADRAAYTAPLREDMLRAVSQSEPRIPATGWPTNGWTFSGTPSTTCSARSRS